MTTDIIVHFIIPMSTLKCLEYLILCVYLCERKKIKINQLSSFSFFGGNFGHVIVLFIHVVHSPVLRSLSVGFAVFLEETVLDESFLAECSRSESPSLGVEISVHDNSFSFGDDTVVASSELRCGHLSDCNGNSFSLSGDDDDFLADFDVVVVSQDSGEHQFSTVANGVDCGILDDDSWEVN